MDSLIARAPGRDAYPAADLLVLLDHERIAVGANAQVQQRREFLYSIFSESVSDSFRHPAIPFDARQDTVVVETARVRTPDGIWRSLPPAAMLISSIPETQWAAAYQYRKQLTCRFDSLVPGSMVHLVYRIEHRAEEAEVTALPGGTVLFGGFQPILQKTFVLDLPAILPLRYELQHGDLKPSVSEDIGRRIFTWTQQHCPVLQSQPGMISPEFLLPRLVWTTISDWEQLGVFVGDAFWNAVDSSDAAVDEFSRVTSPLLMGTPALMHAVLWTQTRIRNIAVPMTATGYLPLSADRVWANRYAAPLDKAVLLTALLRAYGFGAVPALVPYRAVPPTSLPVLQQYQHVVLAVPVAEDTLWIDPAAEDYPPDKLPYAATYGEACLLMGGAPLLLEIPAGSPNERGVRTEIRTSLTTTGELSGFAICEPKGDRAALARHLLKNKDDASRAIYARAAASEISPTARVDGFSITDPNDLATPFVAQLRFTAPAYAEREGSQLTVVVPDLPFAFAALDLEQGGDTLFYPVALPPRGKFETEFVLVLPDNFTAIRIPPPLIVDNPYFHISVTSRQNQRTWTWIQTIEIKADSIPPADFAPVRQALIQAAEPKNRLALLQQKQVVKPARKR